MPARLVGNSAVSTDTWEDWSERKAKLERSYNALYPPHLAMISMSQKVEQRPPMNRESAAKSVANLRIA